MENWAVADVTMQIWVCIPVRCGTPVLGAFHDFSSFPLLLFL
jgi:hypothetical protein